MPIFIFEITTSLFDVFVKKLLIIWLPPLIAANFFFWWEMCFGTRLFEMITDKMSYVAGLCGVFSWVSYLLHNMAILFPETESNLEISAWYPYYITNVYHHFPYVTKFHHMIVLCHHFVWMCHQLCYLYVTHYNNI